MEWFHIHEFSRKTLLTVVWKPQERRKSTPPITRNKKKPTSLINISVIGTRQTSKAPCTSLINSLDTWILHGTCLLKIRNAFDVNVTWRCSRPRAPAHSQIRHIILSRGPPVRIGPFLLSAQIVTGLESVTVATPVHWAFGHNAVSHSCWPE